MSYVPPKNLFYDLSRGRAPTGTFAKVLNWYAERKGISFRLNENEPTKIDKFCMLMLAGEIEQFYKELELKEGK